MPVTDMPICICRKYTLDRLQVAKLGRAGTKLGMCSLYAFERSPGTSDICPQAMLTRPCCSGIRPRTDQMGQAERSIRTDEPSRAVVVRWRLISRLRTTAFPRREGGTATNRPAAKCSPGESMSECGKTASRHMACEYGGGGRGNRAGVVVSTGSAIPRSLLDGSHALQQTRQYL